MRCDRHDVRCTIREPDAGSRVGHLHHVAGEVARRVVHPLMGGGDVAARRVVIRSEVRGDAAAPSPVEEERERRPAVGPENRLRRLDHELELQRFRRSDRVIRSSASYRSAQHRHLLGHLNLRQRDDEPRAEAARRASRRVSEEDVERSRAAAHQLVCEWLDANPE